MKLASTTKKFLIASFSLASVVGLANGLSDAKSYSKSFMNKNLSVIEKRLDDKTRNVASVLSEPSILAVEMTEENIKRINGVWNIYNIVGDSEKVNFNAKFELVGKGLVKVGGEMIYKISFLSDLNTIALYKEVSEGKYEIIEARKIESKEQMKKILEAQKQMAQEGLTVNSKEIDLSVNSASSRAPEKFAGQSVTGSVRISDGMIVNLELKLNNETAFSITEATEIGAAGAFVAQANVGNSMETISGVIINSGNGSYTLRIATGDFEGATVVFDNSSESVEEENVELKVEETPAEVTHAQEQVQNDRKALMDSMNAEMSDVPAENNGQIAFSFESKAE